MININELKLKFIIAQQIIPSSKLIMEVYNSKHFKYPLILLIEIFQQIKLDDLYINLKEYYIKLIKIFDKIFELHLNYSEISYFTLFLLLINDENYILNNIVFIKQFYNSLPQLATNKLFFQHIYYKNIMYISNLYEKLQINNHDLIQLLSSFNEEIKNYTFEEDPYV